MIPGDRPFVMCDFGAADGGVSHDIISDVIGNISDDNVYHVHDIPSTCQTAL